MDAPKSLPRGAKIFVHGLWPLPNSQTVFPLLDKSMALPPLYCSTSTYSRRKEHKTSAIQPLKRRLLGFTTNTSPLLLHLLPRPGRYSQPRLSNAGHVGQATNLRCFMPSFCPAIVTLAFASLDPRLDHQEPDSPHFCSYPGQCPLFQSSAPSSDTPFATTLDTSVLLQNTQPHVVWPAWRPCEPAQPSSAPHGQTPLYPILLFAPRIGP